MRNFTSMMQKAKQAQEKLARIKSELAEITCMGESAGGVVKVEVSGDGQIRAVQIDVGQIGETAAAQTPEDLRLLEDLIVVAMRDAQEKSARIKATRMRDVADGLPLPPGLDLPL